jgi:hypothetical protein
LRNRGSNLHGSGSIRVDANRLRLHPNFRSVGGYSAAIFSDAQCLCGGFSGL